MNNGHFLNEIGKHSYQGIIRSVVHSRNMQITFSAEDLDVEESKLNIKLSLERRETNWCVQEIV